MNQKNVYRPKLEEARTENTEAEEKKWKVLTHTYLQIRSTRNGEKENVADARVEEIMAENISELTKNIKPEFNKCYSLQQDKYKENFIWSYHSETYEK